MVALRVDDRPVLTLAELEAFDPYAPAGGQRRRFLCPLCGDRKRRDAGHRSLSLEVASGLWTCHRCSAKGQLQEHWQGGLSLRQRGLARLKAKLSASVPEPSAESVDRAQLGDVQPLSGTPGAAYLEGRGIMPAVAEAAGVKFSPAFFGRPAVLFPLRDRDGQPIAVNGRYLDARTPKTRTAGPKANALFATAGALDASPIVVTEAPLDALSLAVAGVPALALCGTSWPAWLRVKAGLRRVALAFDADQAGDQAAEKLGAELGSLGATVERWRPDGGKDWNELLQVRGLQGLCEAVLTFDAGERGTFPLIDICHVCGAPAIGYTPDAWRACMAHLDGGRPW